MGLWDSIKKVFGAGESTPRKAPVQPPIKPGSRAPSQIPAARPPGQQITGQRPATSPLLRSEGAAAPVSRPVRAAASHISRMTETRLINTAFGPAQIIDDGETKRLRIRGVPEEFLAGIETEEFGREGVVPFLEATEIEGAYLFDAGKVEYEHTQATARESGELTRTKNAILLPVTASLPYFFLPPYHKVLIERITAYLQTQGEALSLPKTADLTSQVTDRLRQAAVIWKDEKTKFDMARFLSLIDNVQSQEQFPNLMQINLKGNIIYLLSIGRHIAGVFDLSPQFMHLNASKAVRLTYEGNDNTWLAPFGRKGGI